MSLLRAEPARAGHFANLRPWVLPTSTWRQTHSTVRRICTRHANIRARWEKLMRSEGWAASTDWAAPQSIALDVLRKPRTRSSVCQDSISPRALGWHLNGAPETSTVWACGLPWRHRPGRRSTGVTRSA